MSGTTGKSWADRYVKENRYLAPHLIDFLGRDFTPLALTYIIKFIKGGDEHADLFKLLPEKTREEICQIRTSRR